MRVPRLEPNVRLDDEFAGHLAHKLRDQYEAGKSIRAIASDTGYSITRVRGLLEQADVAMRPQGRQPAVAVR
ncbi:MAG: hypothetical protein LBV30_02920 [Propionibacteriaceae bacterium]|nr:hypothetical protein [Propionibacteriaceae bacterium]